MARRVGLAAAPAVAVATMLALGGIALADHVRAVCQVSATASVKPDQGYVLGVRLTTTEGRPVSEATVRLYEVVELFGTREMLVGTARTDGQGNASLLYLPARTGTHQIVVRFPGRDHVAAAEGRTSFEATVAAPPYRPETPALASFSAAVPYAVGLVVLSVWALIAFALFGTARGVRRGARDYAQKGDIA